MRPALPVTALLATVITLPAVMTTADAKPRDRDHDGMPDRWERRHGLDARRGDARGDRDRDGLRNLAEYRARTHPRRRDSDGDGRDDGQEHAGTVLVFADGVLSIALADGSDLTGKVTSRTRIDCSAPATSARNDDEDEDEDEDDDNSGPGGGGHDDEDDDRPSTTTVPTTTGTGTTTGSTTTTAPPTVPGREDDDEDDDHERGCDTSALVAGTPVRDALLKVSSRGRTFRRVRLGRVPASPAPDPAPSPSPEPTPAGRR